MFILPKIYTMYIFNNIITKNNKEQVTISTPIMQFIQVCYNNSKDKEH